MTFQETIVDAIKTYCNEHGGTENAAELLGISANTLRSWFYGQKIPRIETLSEYAEQLGIVAVQTRKPVIHRPAPYAPVEVVKGEDLPEIPVIGSTGAGNDVELFNASPSYWINILPQYMRPGLVGLMVEGDSMEPTVHKGAIVGIVPYDGSINEGGIYLVHRPPFGRTIKRIKMDAEGPLVMHSDNASYAPAIIPDEGYEKILMGRVVWVWQTM